MELPLKATGLHINKRRNQSDFGALSNGYQQPAQAIIALQRRWRKIIL
jgi:hypothetical protein